jgi:glucokinase
VTNINATLIFMDITFGVDVGGTKIAAGVVDEKGEILHETREETPRDSDEIASIVAMMYENAAQKYPEISAIGVGVPGLVSQNRTDIDFTANVNWRNYPLGKIVSESINDAVPVYVENDANSAGWAEFKFGVAKDARDMMMVTVGTGLGGAIVIDNKLIRGRWGSAAEFGHMRLVPHGINCACGLRGCFEQYVSGSAMTRQAKMRAVQEPENAQILLKYADSDVNNITGPLIGRAANEGDPLSIHIIQDTGRWLGEGCASLAALLDTEVIVIGGGVADHGDALLDPARVAFSAHLTMRGYRKEPKLVRAEFGNKAGIVGAAMLAREK